MMIKKIAVATAVFLTSSTFAYERRRLPLQGCAIPVPPT